MSGPDYSRHQRLAQARLITWRGLQFKYSPEFVTQLLVAQNALRPDGPFDARLEEVEIVVGNTWQTVRRGEVEELLDLTLDAATQVVSVLNGIPPKPTEGPAL
jgi:hypothetical protein